jgi:RNA polymerase sigma factor for flagellar operon FliA
MSTVTASPSSEGRRVNDDAVRNSLALAHLGFVDMLARGLASQCDHRVELKELVQDGSLGILKAATRFNESYGVQFETFASRHIRGAMVDGLRRKSWPRNARRQRRELNAAIEKLTEKFGEPPTRTQLARYLKLTEARLDKRILHLAAIEATSSFQKPDEVVLCTLPDICVPPEPESPEVSLDKKVQADEVRAALARLPARERKVMTLYYYSELTMKEIGQEIGVNESRVSQLHARAITRMREMLEGVIV